MSIQSLAGKTRSLLTKESEDTLSLRLLIWAYDEIISEVFLAIGVFAPATLEPQTLLISLNSSEMHCQLPAASHMSVILFH